MKNFINYINKIKEQKTVTKTQFSIAILGILLFLSIFITLPVINYRRRISQNIIKAQAAGTTYYVDNCVVTGNDSNNGTSASSPWLTIAKVNSSTFNPGDSILFEKGCTWR